MTDDADGEHGSDDEMTPTTGEPTLETASYKARGRLEDPDGVGVLGRNDATSGTPVGVHGRVAAPGGYGLHTGDDARVGGTLAVGNVTVEDRVLIDYTGSDGGDHGLEVIDRSTDNSEQISIKADPEGSAELVFQDTDEANFKWGFRVTQDNDFLLDNHANLTTRLELEKDGPTRVHDSRFAVVDGAIGAAGTDSAGRAVDASGGSVRTAGGVVHRQRGAPTTSELEPGEVMTYNSDGSGTGEAGDLIYAVNDGGTIRTSVLAERRSATA